VTDFYSKWQGTIGLLANCLAFSPNIHKEAVMTDVLCSEANSLLESLSAASVRFVREADASNGDFTVAANAVADLLCTVREVAMTKSLELSTRNLPKQIRCPRCQCEVNGWRSGRRRVVTAQGAGIYNRLRYRCDRCHEDYYPTEEANGLTGTSYTLDARKVIAAVAATSPYADAATQLWETRAIPVSAKEVDTIAREISALVERNERELVDTRFGEEAARRQVENPDIDPFASAQALHDMSDWSPSAPALVSVDAAKVRSNQVGDSGLDWFDCRAGIVAPAQDDAQGRTIYVGGVIKCDELFDLLAATYYKSGGKRDLYFVADGAKWIWDRARLYFPNAVQVLDIYHAGEHVASAALAAWGEGSDNAKHWRKHARDLLLKPGGIRTILTALIEQLRRHTAGTNPDMNSRDLVREIRYLFGHRHRMRYYRLHKKNLPIGSGAMESGIKQLSTMRLRLPGMMWTRTGADAILRLRAAHLSGALDGIVKRQESMLKTAAASYRSPELARAA
jgi:hypothetical protein